MQICTVLFWESSASGIYSIRCRQVSSFGGVVARGSVLSESVVVASPGGSWMSGSFSGGTCWMLASSSDRFVLLCSLCSVSRSNITSDWSSSDFLSDEDVAETSSLLSIDHTPSVKLLLAMMSWIGVRQSQYQKSQPGDAWE